MKVRNHGKEEDENEENCGVTLTCLSDLDYRSLQWPYLVLFVPFPAQNKRYPLSLEQKKIWCVRKRVTDCTVYHTHVVYCLIQKKRRRTYSKSEKEIGHVNQKGEYRQLSLT
jgi:hypothetical protein